MTEPPDHLPHPTDRAERVRWWVFSFLQVVMSVGLVLAVYER